MLVAAMLLAVCLAVKISSCNHCSSLQPFSVLRFLTYCPSKRIMAEEALKHEYFRESPLPIEPSMFPTWPAKSEQQRVKRGTSPRPPEGGLGYAQLVRTKASSTCNRHTPPQFYCAHETEHRERHRMPPSCIELCNKRTK